MNANDILEIALEVVYLALVVIAIADYRRHAAPVRLTVISVFACVAIVYVAGTVGRLWPAAAAVTGLIGLLALIGLPYLTLRVVTYFRRVSPSIVRSASFLAVAFAVLAIAVFLGLELPFGETGALAVLVALVAYFVTVEAVAAALLGLEGRRRAGAARARLWTAAVSTALLSLAVLVLGTGGLATLGDATAGAALSLAVRLLTLLAAIGYLLAFLPPRALRAFAQQAIGYEFIRDLNRLPSGTHEDRVWERLAATAMRATGAERAEILLAGDLQGPRVALGSSDVPAPDAGRIERQVIPIPIRIDDTEIGSLSLRIVGTPLFVEDDVELFTVLAQRAARAAERERLIADLRAASAAKSEFLAAMSHELRTPLNAIIGFSELLTMPTDEPIMDTATVTGYADHIHESGLHLLDLINEVLDLARVEAGRIDLHPTRFDIAALVAQTIETMRPLAERKGQQLAIDAVEATEVEADQGRIRQVVYNLLSNAIKFTPDGGSVSVALERVGDTVRVSVTDTGPGIDPADQDRIFEAFQQAGGSSQTQPGTGLGLALARQLIELHRGTIEVESTVGEGSRFTVSLPVLAASIAPVIEPAPDSARPLVLVIEDQPSAAELLRVYLEDAGYRVAVAPDGESGLRWATEHRPGAILLDILLPDLDGWEVLRRLKRHDATRAIPVVVVSIVDDAPLGLALGAIDYFVKPASREALLESLGRLTFTTKVRTRTVKVLVVDADSAAGDDYRALLEPEGFTVCSARSGAEAVKLARTERPDLILLGLALPDGDGADVLATLKVEAATRDTPIWITTPGAPTEADRVRLSGQVLGFVDRDPSALQALREWLDRVGVRTAVT